MNVKIGDKFSLFGTDNVFKIADEENGYWVIKIESKLGEISGVLMTKSDLAESIDAKSLIPLL